MGGVVKKDTITTIDDIDIDPDIGKEHSYNLKRIISTYSEVFSKNPESLPKPMRGIPEHTFKLKPGAKPLYCRRPHWGPQTRKYLTQWTRWAQDEGLLEPTPKSAWASRIVIAPKYHGDTAKSDTPDGLRVCVDFTGVKELEEDEEDVEDAG